MNEVDLLCQLIRYLPLNQSIFCQKHGKGSADVCDALNKLVFPELQVINEQSEFS